MRSFDEEYKDSSRSKKDNKNKTVSGSNDWSKTATEKKTKKVEEQKEKTPPRT